jgi:hypothetical protein
MVQFSGTTELLRVVKIVQEKKQEKIRSMKFSFDGRIIRHFIQSERSRTLHLLNRIPQSQNQGEKTEQKTDTPMTMTTNHRQLDTLQKNNNNKQHAPNLKKVTLPW